MTWLAQMQTLADAAAAALAAAGRPVPDRARDYIGSGRILVNGDMIAVTKNPLTIDPRQCGAVVITGQVEVWRYVDADALQQGQLSPQPGPNLDAIRQVGADELLDEQALSQLVPPPGFQMTGTSAGADNEQGQMIGAFAQFVLYTGVSG